MFRFEKRSREKESGQSLVEMAFGLVVLLIILGGVLDLGRLYFAYVSLEDAAGEAALFLSINPGCQTNGSNPGGGVDCSNPNNASWRASHAGGGIVDFDPATSATTVNIDTKCYDASGVIQLDCRPEAYDTLDAYNGVTTGDIVEVTLTYEYQLLTPVIPEIAGADTIDLVSEARQVIIVVP